MLRYILSPTYADINKTIHFALYSLVARVEKNLSDHTEFVKAKEELESWLQTAHGTVKDCIGSGDLDWAKDKLDTIKLVATRMTEGTIFFC